MTKIKDNNNQDLTDQQLYEIGQFGMYAILKELQKDKLYEKPLLFGLLETLISSIFKSLNNDEVAINVIGNMTASNLKKNQTKH